jgi:hypothetical protein
MRQAENLERGGDFGSGREFDRNGFVTAWLCENLPPFYRQVSVVDPAAQLRADALEMGVDVTSLEQSGPLAIERAILAALNSR